MLGGGSIFLGVIHDRNVFPPFLSDVNPEIMTFWRVLRDSPEDLIYELKRQDRYSYDPETYYSLRAWEPDSPVEVAARFMYLNKSGFNGLYRLNKSGKFNVSFGRYAKAPNWCDILTLTQASSALQGAVIEDQTWEDSLARALPGDLVVLDPPYTNSDSSQYGTAWSPASWDALRNRIDAMRPEVSVMVFDRSTKESKSRWRGYHIHPVTSTMTISRGARGAREDIIVTSYTPEREL
jgi:DNA adenine methylase